jgi:hypothetical protein
VSVDLDRLIATAELTAEKRAPIEAELERLVALAGGLRDQARAKLLELAPHQRHLQAVSRTMSVEDEESSGRLIDQAG